MLRSRCWMGSLTLPILMASAGCSIGHRPNAQANGHLPPERLMTMAQAFERQGRVQQAKNAYQQILAADPNYPDARDSLNTLIAGESNLNRTRFDLSKVPADKMVAQERLELDKKSARTDRRSVQPAATQGQPVVTQVQPTVTQEVAKVAPQQVPQLSVASTVDYKPNKSEEIAIEKAKLETAPAVDQPQVIAINPAKSMNSVERTSEPAVQRPAEIPIEEALIIEDEQVVQTVPEAKTEAIQPAEVSQPADSEPEPEVAEHLPPVQSRSPETLEITTKIVEAELPFSRAEEPFEFVRPSTRIEQVSDVELSKLFGPFRVEMVQYLRDNRERFQSRLVEIACDRQAKVEARSRSILLLGEIGRPAVDALPTLRHQMHDVSDPFLKVDLCEAILKIRPEDEDAIRVLVKSLKDPNSEVRWIAVFALRSAVSPRTTFVIDSLRESIKTDDLKLRRMVFLTLGEFGPAASAALPDLYAALDCNDHATREVAKAAVESIAPDRTAKSILE